MNIIRALILLPQLYVQGQALYDHIRSLDDDPEVKGAFDKFKNDPVISLHYGILKTQAKSLKSLIDQIKGLL